MTCPLAALLLRAALRGSGLVARALLRADGSLHTCSLITSSESAEIAELKEGLLKSESVLKVGVATETLLKAVGEGIHIMRESCPFLPLGFLFRSIQMFDLGDHSSLPTPKNLWVA